ncbi:MAG: lectin like domain-containing protein [Clostridia bacterium]|nr:lectin like domain-containing protein [Clostridia bacterium]
MLRYRRIFPKILLLILVCGAILLPVLVLKNLNLNVSNNDEIAISTVEYSEEYKQYLIDLENGDTAKYGGVIPETCETNYALPDLKLSTGTLNDVYDPRPLNLVTPAKNQRTNISCWAFATLGALEQYYLYKEGVTYDFSEEDMRFVFSNHENSIALGYGYYNTVANGGGNPSRSTAYLSSWLGAVDETSVPYTVGTTWNEKIGTAYLSSLVTDTAIIPYTASFDSNIIKEYILEYGSVQTSTFYDYHYYEDFGASYYYNGTNPANHAILLVGWDDNYNKDWFLDDAQPTSNGAWIVKNSQGTGYGYDGFYWISYEDAVLNREGTLFTTITGATQPTPNKKMLTNDYLGETASCPLDSSTTSITIANVFEINDLTYNKISDIMFFAGSPSNYSISITKCSNGIPNSAGTTVATGYATTKGYVTVTLDTPYNLSSIGKYAIVITLSNATSGLILTLETNIGTIHANVNSGESFVYSGSSWYDLSAGEYASWKDASGNLVANFVIRAILYNENADFEIDTATITGETTEGANVSLVYTIDNSLNARIAINTGVISYKWQISTTGLEGGTWTDISSQTSSTLIITSNYSGKYIRAVVICDGSGNVVASSFPSNVLRSTTTLSNENTILSFSMTINSSGTTVPATLYTDHSTYGNSITSKYVNNNDTVLLNTVYEISEKSTLTVYSSYSAGVYSNVVSSTSITTTKSRTKVVYAIVTAESGDIRAYTVTINQLPFVAVTSVEVSSNTTSTELLRGGSYTFSATIFPENATNKNVVWSVAGSAIISTTGILTIPSFAINLSKITITATSECNDTISDSFQVTAVNGLVSEVVIFDRNLPLTLLPSESQLFTATALPSSALNKNVIWLVTGNANITAEGVLTVNANANNDDIIIVTASAEEDNTICDTYELSVSLYPISADNYSLSGWLGDIHNDIQWYLSQVILTPIFPTNFTIAVITNNGDVLTASGGLFSINIQGENNIVLYFTNSSDVCTDTLNFSICIDSETNVLTPEIIVPYSSTENHTYGSLITNIVYVDSLTFSSLPAPNKISFSYSNAKPVSDIKGYEFALKSSTQNISDITYTYIAVEDLSTLYTVLAQQITIRIGTQNYLQFKGNIYLRAVSGAGMVSASVCTNGIIIDNAQPLAPTIYMLAGGTVYTADTYTKEDISITLSNADSISGIAKYRYRYRDINSAQFSSWEDVTGGLATLKNKIDITIDCERIYQILAVSKAGIIGTDNISQIIVKRDTISPTISYVSGNPTDWVHSAEIQFEYTVGKCGLNNLIVQKNACSQLLESNATSFIVTENGIFSVVLEDNLNRIHTFEIEITFIETAEYTIYEFIDVLTALPALVTEEDRAYIVELYDIYNNYSPAKKETITNLNKLTVAIQTLSTSTERVDAETGATIKADNLPFNVMLQVDSIGSNTTDFAIVKSRNSEKDLLSLYNINLTQSGTDYEFENITVKLVIPENQSNSTNYSVIYVTDGGIIEFVDCTIQDGYISFLASSSGTYGIMFEEVINNTIWIILIVLGSIILTVLATLFIIKNVKIKKSEKLYEQEKLNGKKIEKQRNSMKMSEKFNPDNFFENEGSLSIGTDTKINTVSKPTETTANNKQTDQITKPVGSVFGIKSTAITTDNKPVNVIKQEATTISANAVTQTVITSPISTIKSNIAKTTRVTPIKSLNTKKRKNMKSKSISKPFKLKPNNNITKETINNISIVKSVNINKLMVLKVSKKMLSLSKNKKH